MANPIKMETRAMKRKRLESLPGGDRRGAPGAGAGCSSMRSIGDVELSRRAPVDKSITAESQERNNYTNSRTTATSTRSRTPSTSSSESLFHTPPSSPQWFQQLSSPSSSSRVSPFSSPKSLFSSLPSSPPSYINHRSSPIPILSTSYLAESVVQTTTVENAAPVKAKKSVRKRKWTNEMNIFVLRTYLLITKLETDTNNYLTELHNRFIEKFPNIDVTKQKLGGQRRAIINNNYLSDSEIQNIKSEVEAELQNNQSFHPNTQRTKTQPSRHTQPCRRTRWSVQHNEAIMKAYYKITRLETNQTAYRKPLYQSFITLFPELSHMSVQRIAEQRKLIIENKYITEDRLQSIKNEVALELHMAVNDIRRSPNRGFTSEPIIDNTEPIVDTTEPTFSIESSTESTINIEPFARDLNTQRDNADTSIEQIETNLSLPDRDIETDEMFNKVLQYFRNTNPNSRPYIPKQKTSKKFYKIVNYLNNISLPETVTSHTDFSTLQTAIYSAAWTAAKLNGAKLDIPLVQNSNNRTQQQHARKPKWQKRLEIKVEDLRKKIGRLTDYINGSRNRTLERQVKTILGNYKLHTVHEQPNTNMSHFLDTLKQKLTVVSSRLRRYKECTQRKVQNNHFNSNEKKFYQTLSNTTNNHTLPTNNERNTGPPTDEMRQFWANIWENPVSHNREASWIESEINNNKNLSPMEFQHIPVNIFQNVIKASHNWKTPGSDNIHNYWYKKFTQIQPYLYQHINNFIQNPDQLPDYITDGVTFMIPKDHDNLPNPANYRPITCLQTIYKIITSCLSQLIYTHINANDILTEEQKGCRKFSQGCKEQLIIDSVVLNQVKHKKRDLYTMYIDYRKAYDSVPHSWLVQVLEVYKIHPKIISFLTNAMANWTTCLILKSYNYNNPLTSLESEPIKIQRGIFQGDSLSPLWFCLALNPLSKLLNSNTNGYDFNTNNTIAVTQTNTLLSHLLYMDDIKLYASTQTDLEELAKATEQFSNDICMQFGIDKCKINSIRSGHNYQHQYDMQNGQKIDALNDNETYKYLGYQQSQRIHVNETKLNLKQKFKHRLNSILKTQLNSKNTIKALNSYAVPILTYSFGIINWTQGELKSLQSTINVIMTKNRKHHPRACVQRQVLPRSVGGRGIIHISNLHNKQITSLRTYFHTKADTSLLHKIIVCCDKKYTPLNLADNGTQRNERQVNNLTLQHQWAVKSLHGRHHHDLSQPNVDKQASNEWLSRGELFPETEGFMIAIQDQVIETRNYQKYIMKLHNLPTDSCRKCNSSSETIQHITGACKSIAQTDYKFRHDQVANIIHQKLAYKHNLLPNSETITPYYKYTPEVVLENRTHKLYFDRAILTDKTTHFNRPDITLINKIDKTALIIDIAIPNTHNLQSTISEKLTKYIDLKDEITRMWRLRKVTIVPIVLSTTGVIPKQLAQSLALLDLPKFIYIQLQKAVILNTCRIVRKFLQTDNSAPETQPTQSLHTNNHLA